MATYEELKEEFLAHVGVKGMRWGKRKQNPGYSDKQVSKDRRVAGNGGVKRINDNLDKGLTLGKARQAEGKRAATVFSVQVLASGVGYAALAAGAKYISAHPEVLQKASVALKNQKAIGVGYDVIKLGLKSGRWG